jgi:hypothetical protein
VKLTVLDDPVAHTVRLPTLAKNVQDAIREFRVYKTKEHWLKCLDAAQLGENEYLSIIDWLHQSKP